MAFLRRRPFAGRSRPSYGMSGLAALGRVLAKKASLKGKARVAGARKSRMRRPRPQGRSLPVFKNVKVEGAGGQISSFKASAKPSQAMLAMKRVNASNYVYYNQGNRYTVAPGYQGIWSYPIFSGGQWSSTQTANNDLGYIAYRASGGTTFSAKTMRYGVESATATMRITNQDTGSVEIKIFDVVCKRDTANDPLTAIVTGLNNENSATSYTNTTLPLGILPSQSSYFNANYKVKCHTRILLGQGQSHYHYINLRPNRIVNSEMLEDNNISFKGWTYFTVIMASGVPSNDTTTVTNVTTGNCNLDVVWNKTMRYTWSQDGTVDLYAQDNLLHSFAVGESVMSLGAGVKATDVPA